MESLLMIALHGAVLGIPFRALSHGDSLWVRALSWFPVCPPRAVHTSLMMLRSRHPTRYIDSSPVERLNDALRRYDDVERRIEDISAKSGYGSDLIYDNAVPVYARNAEQLEMTYYSYLSYMADCDVGGLVASGLSFETMCGIVGYAGNVSATCGKPLQVCLQGLQRLEYRGYDSAEWRSSLRAWGMQWCARRPEGSPISSKAWNVTRCRPRRPPPDTPAGPRTGRPPT